MSGVGIGSFLPKDDVGLIGDLGASTYRGEEVLGLFSESIQLFINQYLGGSTVTIVWDI